MSGTKTGGKAAAESNKTKYGSDFYRRIGKKGGEISRGGGFTAKTASKWGRVGGSISRRHSAKKTAKAAEQTKVEQHNSAYDKLVDQLNDKEITHSEFMFAVEKLDRE